MQKNNLLKKYITYTRDNLGLLGILGLLFVAIYIAGLILIIFKLLICTLIGVRPIDDESGNLIKIDWVSLIIVVGFGWLLILVEQIYIISRNLFKK